MDMSLITVPDRVSINVTCEDLSKLLVMGKRVGLYILLGLLSLGLSLITYSTILGVVVL
jgi:hypothetical protein